MDLGSWPGGEPAVAFPPELPPAPELPQVRVLHVITRFWAGAGGNTLVTALGQRADGYRVDVAGSPGGALWQRAQSAGVGVHEIRGFREVLTPVDVLVLWRLIRLLRRLRPDIVHTHSTKGGVLGRLAARVCRVPVVVHTFHGFAANADTPRFRRAVYLLVERRCRRLAHHYLAVSPRVAAQAVQQRLAPPSRITVAVSAVELDGIPFTTDPTVRRELGIPEDVPVVGTVGRIDQQKAPLEFVAAAALLHQTVPDAVFVMVGDGPLREEAEQHARAVGVPLICTGHRDDAARIASAFDVFTITSRYEGLGRALTEALASGRPVVATAVNGVPDLVEHGVTGLLVPPGDPGAASLAMEWLLNHPELAARMAAQGRRRARGAFSPEAMCRAIDTVYRSALGLPDLVLPEGQAAGGHDSRRRSHAGSQS